MNMKNWNTKFFYIITIYYTEVSYMLDKNINKFNGLQSFFVEFFAYSITNIGIVKKIYIKPVFNEKKIQDQKIILDNKKLNLLSQVLKSNILSSFFSDRYSLYDISFRKSKSSSSIGFSFNDIKDSSYIEPIKIFQIFECFETDSVVNITKRIQKSIFKQQPQYNPIFMIGFVAENTVMTCIEYSCEMKSHFRKSGNQMSGKWKSSYTSLLA